MISVDTKKKELVGNFKNGGREWQPKGTPPAVLVHDFPTDAEGKAIPYGVYDMARNEAWVSVGWDHRKSGVSATRRPHEESVKPFLGHTTREVGGGSRLGPWSDLGPI